ncbi:MAG: sulfotransferase domain-containing protein [Planctomycetes bacterium]|nr:sulfotransferase domain-containing protein [Planctomycetota bacterium]
MIILSAGMQKAGTGWYWNMTNELLMAAGYLDSRDIREKYQLHAVLTTANCNVRGLDDQAILELDRISQQGHTFVVKTHRRPSKLVRKLMAEGRMRATYIYRDLRDAIVSALDRGRVMRETGELHGRHFYIGPQRSFAKYHTVRGGILWARWRLVPVWKAWSRYGGVLMTRYEDLHADTHGQLRRLAEFLEVDVSDDQIEAIVSTYHRDRIKNSQEQVFLHFNKGVAGRFREVLTSKQQELCRKRLGRYLEMMGYLG